MRIKYKEPTILHLGGTSVPSSTFTLPKEMDKHYFFERITITTQEGEQIHVYGNVLKNELIEWQAQSPDKSFGQFIKDKMEANPAFKEAIQQQKVRYLTEEEREATKIIFHQGQLLQVGLDKQIQTPQVLKKGSYAFVLGKDGLHLATKKPTVKGKIQHSSFYRSGRVLSAGMIEIDEAGKIVGNSQYLWPLLPT